MRVKALGTLAVVAVTLAAGGTFAAAGTAGGTFAAAGTAAHHDDYEPVLDPANFVRVIDNPYYPLPVGRTLVYRGIRDGITQTDRVHVTSRTKVIE